MRRDHQGAKNSLGKALAARLRLTGSMMRLMTNEKPAYEREKPDTHVKGQKSFRADIKNLNGIYRWRKRN